MPSNGQDDAALDAWEALHQGLEREGVDSPSKYVLNKSAVLLPVRVPGVGRYGPVKSVTAPAPPARPAPPTARPVPEMAPAAAKTGPKHSTMPGVPASAPQQTGRHRMMMRPYARTRGRTRPDYDLALEALVSTSDEGRRYQGPISVQHRRICELCWAGTRSVAEIAAHMVLPLNVVKVLVSDMDNLGLVMVHQPGLSFGDRSSREFMARVLKGLRAM